MQLRQCQDGPFAGTGVVSTRGGGLCESWIVLSVSVEAGSDGALRTDPEDATERRRASEDGGGDGRAVTTSTCAGASFTVGSRRGIDSILLVKLSAGTLCEGLATMLLSKACGVSGGASFKADAGLGW